MFELKGRWLNWAITAASCQGFLLLGYDQGVMSGIIGAENQFGKDFNSPDANMQGLIVSIYDGNGFNSSNIPAYQSELAKPKNRGMLLSAQGTVTIVGLCIAYWMDFGLSYVDGPIQWRWTIAFQAFFAICLVLQMLPLPETPRFLIEKDRNAEAADVLARLDNTTIDDVEVVEMAQTIRMSIEKETHGGPFQYKELLQGGPMGNFRRIMLCLAVNVMQQFTVPAIVADEPPRVEGYLAEVAVGELVEAACLDDGHADRRIFGEASGNDGAGDAGADDDVVVGGVHARDAERGAGEFEGRGVLADGLGGGDGEDEGEGEEGVAG
ncbi:hypothetical protein SLS56_007622 [Neofusicoccum ribis]|uniref:Major facilitator superfamily (MFS) profile domain-containing protein n=1 Tax=Neofusicoccum ribis TaxID=45134 RepID=A0ABR3SMI4_9PEZI